MPFQSRRKDEFGVRVVFDETWWYEPLNGLAAVDLLVLQASTPFTVLHATSTPTIGRAVSTGSRLGVECLGSIENGPVASAPTQISIEGLLDIMLRRVWFISQESIEAHDDTWGTKTALGAVTLGDTLLGRVWLLDVADALNGDDMFAVDGCQWGETCVDTGVVDLLGRGIILRYNDGTGTASTLATAT